MSADNWTTCPRCEARRVAEIARRSLEVDAIYGTVTVTEFDTARVELQNLKVAKLGDTFREDYEIYGAEDGEVKVNYIGACGTCNLRLTFEHSHPLDVDGA